jgi:tRNA A-37 threonylcarbamoyl transferase component Bud32
LRTKFDGIIITEEVKNATDLKNMAIQFSSIFQHKLWRIEVIKTIAHYVATLHKEKFLHYDLQWRNILVTKSPSAPEVFFFDIPSGRIRQYFFSLVSKRDFYNLYKSAVLFLSRTDQLRFYLWYQSASRLTKQHKKHIKKMIAYYHHKEYKDSLA